MTQRLYRILFWLGIAMTAYGADDVCLEDFRSANPEHYWIFRDVGIYHIPHGDSATLQLTYPQWQPGADECPSSILNSGQGQFQHEDWSGYEMLSFQLVHETGTPGRIELRLDDADGKQFFRAFPLEPYQNQTCTVPVAEIARELDVKRMRHFDLWMLKPEAKRVVTLGPIRLTNDPYTPRELEQLRGLYREAVNQARQTLQSLPEVPAVTTLAGQLAGEAGLLEQVATSETLLRNPEYPRLLAAAVDRAVFLSQQAGPLSVTPIASTVKLRPDQMPEHTVPAELEAARGEAESLGFLITANTDALSEVTIQTTPFRNRDGQTIAAEWHRAGYVPVKNPTVAPCGFGIAGDYPDPLLPLAPFAVPRFENRLLWLTAWVPEDATPGDYQAEFTVSVPGMEPIATPVQLRVYPVTLPKSGKLKSCWIYRNDAAKAAYNGTGWNDESAREFVHLLARYRLNAARFNSSVELPWNRVFSESAGRITADWREWDAAVAYWMHEQGRNTFLVNYPDDSPEVTGEKLRLLGEHLQEKGWSENFYFYLFDEPAPARTQELRALCDSIHGYAPNLNILLTASYENIAADYVGYADIFVPHINLVDPDFGRERIAAGDQYWVYACVGTNRTTYPDNWKIDAPGSAPRALGWWMYRYGIQGYLYWAVDYWQVDPWTSTETYPTTNGDGSMFYPAPDRNSQPYPSIRLEQTRDGIEDYELLQLLQARYPHSTDPEIRSLLEADGIILAPAHYNRDDDRAYQQKHRQLLELLSQ